VALAENEDVIETFTAHAPQKALTVRVHLWGAGGGTQHSNAHGRGGTVKVLAEPIVVVADDESRRRAAGRRIPQLLRDPRRVGISRDADLNDPARAEIDDEEREDRPEPDVVELQKVACPDLTTVIFEKGGPGLSCAIRSPDPANVILDRPLADVPTLSNSPRMRSAPQSMFSSASRRITAMVSGEMRGGGGRCFDFFRQKSRKPARCHRRTVSGFTSRRAALHPGTSRQRVAISPRSWAANRGFFACRVTTMSC
jgi:hypothetical protein